jgi:hypothetical protein
MIARRVLQPPVKGKIFMEDLRLGDVSGVSAQEGLEAKMTISRPCQLHQSKQACALPKIMEEGDSWA